MRRPCLVMAHRGGAAEVAENTWSAVEHVHRLGMDWMETDARVTSDGVVVLSHDADLSRTTGESALISERTWAWLSRVRCADGGKLVRLDELLGSYPQLHLNLDLKDARALEPALRDVRRAGALERVRFASFSSRRLARVRRLEPLATTSMGIADIASLLAAAQLGAPLPRGKNAWPTARVDAAQVPVSIRGVLVVTPRFIATAHRAGIAVHVWTIDDEVEMRELWMMGVDAIMSDRPALALDVLR